MLFANLDMKNKWDELQTGDGRWHCFVCDNEQLCLYDVRRKCHQFLQSVAEAKKAEATEKAGPQTVPVNTAGAAKEPSACARAKEPSACARAHARAHQLGTGSRAGAGARPTKRRKLTDTREHTTHGRTSTSPHINPPLALNLLPFEQAREFMLQQNLKTKSDWDFWCARGMRPVNIPGDPEGVYTGTGWSGFVHWLCGAATTSSTDKKYDDRVPSTVRDYTSPLPSRGLGLGLGFPMAPSAASAVRHDIPPLAARANPLATEHQPSQKTKTPTARYAATAASQRLHAANVQALTKRESSAFHGVHWSKRDQTWYSQVKKKGKTKYIGSYVDKDEAARAFDTAARNAGYEEATLNFPQGSNTVVDSTHRTKAWVDEQVGQSFAPVSSGRGQLMVALTAQQRQGQGHSPPPTQAPAPAQAQVHEVMRTIVNTTAQAQTHARVQTQARAQTRARAFQPGPAAPKPKPKAKPKAKPKPKPKSKEPARGTSDGRGTGTTALKGLEGLRAASAAGGASTGQGTAGQRVGGRQPPHSANPTRAQPPPKSGAIQMLQSLKLPGTDDDTHELVVVSLKPSSKLGELVNEACALVIEQMRQAGNTAVVGWTSGSVARSAYSVLRDNGDYTVINLLDDDFDEDCWEGLRAALAADTSIGKFKANKITRNMKKVLKGQQDTAA